MGTGTIPSFEISVKGGLSENATVPCFFTGSTANQLTTRETEAILLKAQEVKFNS
jgi:hypothetical protein